MSKPQTVENYDEEYVINCIIPLMEFINNHGSLDQLSKKEIRTDNSEKREENSTITGDLQKQTPSENKTNDRSLLLSSQQPVLHVKIQQPKQDNETITRKDTKKLKQIERQDPRAETLALTNRWKQVVKPNDYRMTKGVWKKYNPQRFNRTEIKRIEKVWHQKINKVIWKRMEQQSQESPHERTGQEELYKVIKKIRNTPTNNNNEQRTSGETQIEETDHQSEETMSSHSNDSIDAPTITFKKYLGATGVRYVQMRQASHVQHNNELNLEETIRQAEQKFTTDLKTTATETTNDDKCLKSLVCLERSDHNKKSTNAEHGETNFKNIEKNNRRRRRKFGTNIRLWICIRAEKTRRTDWQISQHFSKNE